MGLILYEDMKVEIKSVKLTSRELAQIQTAAPDTLGLPDIYKVLGWLCSKQGKFVLIQDKSLTLYKIPWMSGIKCSMDTIQYVNMFGVLKTRKFPSANYRAEFVNRYTIFQNRAVEAGQIYI